MTFSQSDDTEQRLAPFVVGYADHSCLEHRWMAQEYLFHLTRGDVEPAPDDEVLLPVNDVDVALLVDACEVAGVQPAVAQRLRSANGIPVSSPS